MSHAKDVQRLLRGVVAIAEQLMQQAVSNKESNDPRLLLYCSLHAPPLCAPQGPAVSRRVGRFKHHSGDVLSQLSRAGLSDIQALHPVPLTEAEEEAQLRQAPTAASVIGDLRDSQHGAGAAPHSPLQQMEGGSDDTIESVAKPTTVPPTPSLSQVSPPTDGEFHVAAQGAMTSC